MKHFAQLGAIDVGHRVIEQGDVEQPPDCPRLLEDGTRLPAASDAGTLGAPARSSDSSTRRFISRSSAISTRRPAISGCAGPSAAALVCTGKVNQNVEPHPGLLSMPMVPPMRSTSWRQIANPEPVPP